MIAFVYHPNDTEYKIPYNIDKGFLTWKVKNADFSEIKKEFPELTEYIKGKLAEEAQLNDKDFVLIGNDNDCMSYYSTNRKLIVDTMNPESMGLLSTILTIKPVVPTTKMTIVFVQYDDEVDVVYYKRYGNNLHYFKTDTIKTDINEIYSTIKYNIESFGTNIALKLIV